MGRVFDAVIVILVYFAPFALAVVSWPVVVVTKHRRLIVVAALLTLPAVLLFAIEAQSFFDGICQDCVTRLLDGHWNTISRTSFFIPLFLLPVIQFPSSREGFKRASRITFAWSLSLAFSWFIACT